MRRPRGFVTAVIMMVTLHVTAAVNLPACLFARPNSQPGRSEGEPPTVRQTSAAGLVQIAPPPFTAEGSKW